MFILGLLKWMFRNFFNSFNNINFHEIIIGRDEFFSSKIKNRKTRYEIYVFSNFIPDFSMEIGYLKISINNPSLYVKLAKV